VATRDKRWLWVRRALLACLGFGLAGACSNPEYKFRPPPDAGPDAPEEAGPKPPSTPTACGSDDECSALPATQLCDRATGYCAECDPAREAELLRCGDGLVCDPSGRCVLGCAADADCGTLTCDVATGRCVNCTADAECQPGTLCVESVCTPSCATGDTCPLGWSCCDGVCRNALTDPESCGGCGTACDPAGACWNGACGNGPCEAGFAECDGLAETVCEVDVRDDPANCGKCRVACASNFCSGGVCTTMECARQTADCNESESDHCETDLTTVDDCGTCNNACDATNGTPSCDDGTCAIDCDDDFGDCDELADTGCEVSFLDDEDNCGDCGVTCTNEHGSTTCRGGECVPRCANGYEDCNGNAADGCETNVNDSLANCGGCGVRCRPDNATPTCDDGVCKGACEDGFEDCNGNPEDGCEADLSAPETCGTCDNACSDIGGEAGCDMGTCTIECADGFADCTGGEADGCETNTKLSPTNCNGCGNVCDSSVGTAVCTDGVCGISTCTFPFEECIPGNPRCETDLRETDQYCGDCGTNCTMRFPNASGVCNGGACVLEECADGFADCNMVADDGCETALETTDHCRTCAEKCEAVHGNNACNPSTGCVPSCQSGWGDCDGNKNNGCETPLNTLFNCGGCDVACNKAHATESCATGSCDIVACDTGWGDCNSESTPNGCETQLTSLTHCGTCNVPCDLAGGTESCGTGTCVLTGCNTGRADCTAAAGCETVLGTTSNCLGCGDACNAPSGTSSNNCVSPATASCSPACGSGQTCRAVNGTNTCVATATVLGCNPACATGYKSCDGDRGNGCEKNIRTLSDCGDCGVGCDLPHATESCMSGTCTATSCDPGWFDCSAGSPGCETQANTTTNCSACGAGCVNAHGTAACNNGSCTYGCNAGWDACDGSAANGCETSTRTLTDCGSCGNDCDISGSGETCATGTCVATMCDPTSADCDSNGSCETTLGNAAHCRSCVEVCTNANGTTSCNTTTGCAPVCSTGFKSCDSDPNNGCEKSIRTLTDCGDCGIPCDIPNATESCSSGTCTITGCSSGYDDCGNDGTCDPLGTNTNCGACGDACTNSHGSNVCTSGACVPACDTGWRSCDGNVSNGCERDVRTLTDCGTCNAPCGFAHGGESCATGSCVMTGCDAGWGDCTPGGDCETQLNTTAACGSCSVQCTNANGTTACTSGACSPTCATGYKSCDSNLNNGCERNIRTLTDCGDCGVTCSFPNAAASCGTGTCTQGTCNSDYGDCTASPGCETQLNTTAACGSCNVQCTNSNGTTACTGSAGSRVCNPTCNTGFGNCDLNPNNGCEAALNTPSACGACGVVCGTDTPNCVLTGSTYKCQAQITTTNDVDGSVGSNTLNMTHTLLAGANRLILLAVVAESAGNGIAGSRPDSVTYGGTTMTFAGEQGGVSNNGATGTCTNPSGCTTCYDWWGPDEFVYYLVESGLSGKAVNSSQAVVVNGATAPSPQMIIANLVQLQGVRQATPISAFNGGFLGTCAGADPGDPSVISPVVSIATTGSRIYSFMSALWGSTAACPGGCPTYGITPAMGTPNELYNSPEVNNGASMRAFFRYTSPGSAAAPTPGTYTPSFSHSNIGRMTHFAVVIHPAQQ
jgi:hypothetical protein